VANTVTMRFEKLRLQLTMVSFDLYTVRSTRRQLQTHLTNYSEQDKQHINTSEWATHSVW